MATADHTERTILKDCVDFHALLKSNPEVFNFSRLSIEDKSILLERNFNLYVDIIDITKLSLKDKVFIAIQGPSRSKAMIKFTAEELKKVSDESYAALLQGNFKKYISKVRFEDLSRSYQSMLFVTNPEWITKNISKPPKLTAQQLEQCSRCRPSFIKKYVADYNDLVTTSSFWVSMIKYDKSYKSTFLENLHSCATKTDIRFVFRKYPDLIKDLTKDIVIDSQLSIKEWILLISTLIDDPKFKDWTFPEDLAEIFRYDLVAELLTGKSKMTKRLKNAMGIFNTEDTVEETIEDKNETETV